MRRNPQVYERKKKERKKERERRRNQKTLKKIFIVLGSKAVEIPLDQHDAIFFLFHFLMCAIKTLNLRMFEITTYQLL